MQHKRIFFQTHKKTQTLLINVAYFTSNMAHPSWYFDLLTFWIQIFQYANMNEIHLLNSVLRKEDEIQLQMINTSFSYTKKKEKKKKLKTAFCLKLF